MATLAMRTRTVHPLLTEVTLLLVLFAAYKWGRTLVEGGVPEAMANASFIWDLERTLHLPDEHTLQKLALHWDLTALLSNLYYVGVHFPATAALLVWLWTRHREHYARIRTELVLLTAAGMAVHTLYPLAPPRLAGLGMTDTMLTVGPSAYPAAADGIANQYAAMPSLHVGWALLVSLAVVRVSSVRWRWLIALHAPVTVVVVVVTANHYWLDGLVAAALLVTAIGAAHLLYARRRDQYALAA
ncbi:phosphatase PAP2 family protein [Spirillospora sp. NPDC047279]|uniref:phosphatase PAP2 family protein n=1 Tax=Spirillospora sp. NPDC047279 TaxID=3155478 RepID=UPI0033D1A96C